MKDQHSSRNCVLGHRVYGIPFQESYLKDLWWALMQAASHFLFRKDHSQERWGHCLWDTRRCVWQASLKGHLKFSCTRCLSSSTYASSFSLHHVKVLPTEKLLDWCRLHFSVEICVCVVSKKKIKKRDERGSFCSPSPPRRLQIWKVINLCGPYEDRLEQMLNTLELFLPTK